MKSDLVVISWWSNCLGLACLHNLATYTRNRNIYVVQVGKRSNKKNASGLTCRLASRNCLTRRIVQPKIGASEKRLPANCWAITPGCGSLTMICLSKRIVMTG